MKRPFLVVAHGVGISLIIMYFSTKKDREKLSWLKKDYEVYYQEEILSFFMEKHDEPIVLAKKILKSLQFKQ